MEKKKKEEIIKNGIGNDGFLTLSASSPAVFQCLVKHFDLWHGRKWILIDIH